MSNRKFQYIENLKPKILMYRELQKRNVWVLTNGVFWLVASSKDALSITEIIWGEG
jgi:hypothetical protein